MRKTNIKITAMMLAALLPLTGCGNAVTYMTDAQAAMIGEYAATLLLEYDTNYKTRLVDMTAVEEEKQEEEKPQEEASQEEQEKAEKDTPVIEKDTIQGEQEMSAGNGAFSVPEGVEVVYKGYEFLKEFKEEELSYFSLEASEGKKLLVMNFSIVNTTSEAQMVDLLAQKLQVKVTLDGTYSKYALTTMLMNDLATYKEELAAQEAVDTVLIIEVEDSMEEELHSLVLNWKSESEVRTITLF